MPIFFVVLLPEIVIIVLNKLFGLSYLDADSVLYFEQLVDHLVEQIQQSENQEVVNDK